MISCSVKILPKLQDEANKLGNATSKVHNQLRNEINDHVPQGLIYLDLSRTNALRSYIRPNAKEGGSKILRQANTSTKTRRARRNHIRGRRMHDRGEFQSRQALASAFPTPTTTSLSFRLSLSLARLPISVPWCPYTQRISDIITVWWGMAVV